MELGNMKSQKIGFIAEKKALDYLQKMGLVYLDANFRCAMGEIDLIMRDKEFLVFIEVRKRKNTTYGGGLLSVGSNKRKKIINTSINYLWKKNLGNKYPIRFDIVSIDGTSAEINWIKAAFDADS